MSLKIWLPMNRDLRNQGLLNNTITNSGATYSSDGKLGGCYIFDGVDDSLAVGNLSTMVETDFSFACWFYKDEWGSKGYETIFGGPSGFELESKVSSTNSPVLKLYNWGGGSCTYELSKWNHIVFTRNSTETKLYLNGELKVTGSAGTIPNNNYFVGSWNSATQQNFKGKMCDVRIYDNCLSPIEIKQLSQGLILHYPLNRGGFGQENLIRDTQGVFVSGLGSTDGSRAEFRSRTLGCSLPIETEKTYTLSFDLKMILNTPSNSPYFLVYNSNYKGPHGKWIWQPCDSMLTGNYSAGDIIEKKIIIHFTTPTSFEAGSYTNDNIEFYSNYGSSNWFEVSNLKLEEGDIATPWCPNSSDALATTMGLNSTIEYDCSGFCNNGTRTGTFSWTSDTPKYQVSTNFNGSNYIGLVPPDSEIQTVAFWVKWSSIPSTQTIGFIDDGSGLAFGLSYGNIIVSCQVAGAASCYNASVLSANNWYHIVVVKTGATTRKLYINAVEQTTNSTTNYWSYINNELQIGKRKNTGEGIIGWMSDFRAYATALSADDVKSLYQNCATIDPDGTIRGQIRS